jgi:hypothetical protein
MKRMQALKRTQILKRTQVLVSRSMQDKDRPDPHSEREEPIQISRFESIIQWLGFIGGLALCIWVILNVFTA